MGVIAIEPIECMWTSMGKSEHSLMHITTDSYMQLSAHEHLYLWASVNEIECTWACMNTFEQVLDAIKYNWMHLTVYVHTIEGNLMQLNGIEYAWMHLSKYWNVQL